MMTRKIRFHLSLSEIGITGCTLRMKRLNSDVPTFCSQLNCSGTLTRSEIGFDSFFASAALSSSGGGCCAAVREAADAISDSANTVLAHFQDIGPPIRIDA